MRRDIAISWVEDWRRDPQFLSVVKGRRATSNLVSADKASCGLSECKEDT